MMNTSDILSNKPFNYQDISIDKVSVGDDYMKVDFKKIEEIYVIGKAEKIDLLKKYEQLKFFKGYIHIKEGLSIEIDCSKIKSLRLRDKYLHLTKLKTRKEIEREFGKADYLLTDGIMWVFDYVVDAKVLVYKKLKLYLHIDPETDNLKEIRFGDIDEQYYD